MTLTSLKREVAALCFDKSVSAAEGFCFFANRALRKIFADRGVSKTVKLCVSPRTPKRSIAAFVHKGGERISFSAKGGSYLIETSGEGSFTVKDELGERSYGFNSEFTRHKGFINGKGNIIFIGDYTYTVVKIDLFESNFGSEFDSIPDGDGCLDLNEIFHDVACVSSLPTSSDGTPIFEAQLEDGRITLPESFEGNIFVTYLRSPRPISEDTPEEKIDVGEDCSHLLPLLCASFLCLECDPERAEKYSELYKEEMEGIAKRRKRLSAAYIVGDGWS